MFSKSPYMESNGFQQRRHQPSSFKPVVENRPPNIDPPTAQPRLIDNPSIHTSGNSSYKRSNSFERAKLNTASTPTHSKSVGNPNQPGPKYGLPKQHSNEYYPEVSISAASAKGGSTSNQLGSVNHSVGEPKTIKIISVTTSSEPRSNHVQPQSMNHNNTSTSNQSRPIIQNPPNPGIGLSVPLTTPSQPKVINVTTPSEPKVINATTPIEPRSINQSSPSLNIPKIITHSSSCNTAENPSKMSSKSPAGTQHKVVADVERRNSSDTGSPRQEQAQLVVTPMDISRLNSSCGNWQELPLLVGYLPSTSTIDLTSPSTSAASSVSATSVNSVTVTTSRYTVGEHQATISAEQTSGDCNTNADMGELAVSEVSTVPVTPEPVMLTPPHPFSQDSCVYDILVCSACKVWMIPGQDIFCACKVVCISCAAPLIKCEDCHHSFKQDIRLTNFRQRLAQQINRPCNYKHSGCQQVLKPGDEEHESNCDYRPVPCTKCKDYVSKAHMKDHFYDEHFLTEKNRDVKLKDFYLDESTKLKEIRCKTNRGQYLYFTISKVETSKFVQFWVIRQCNETNVSVKFDFIMNGYSYARTATGMMQTDPNDMQAVSIIDIERIKYDDWVNDKCTLNIDVTVRRKPVKKLPFKENAMKVSKKNPGKKEMSKMLKIQKKKTIQQKQKKARLSNFKLKNDITDIFPKET